MFRMGRDQAQLGRTRRQEVKTFNKELSPTREIEELRSMSRTDKLTVTELKNKISEHKQEIPTLEMAVNIEKREASERSLESPTDNEEVHAMEKVLATEREELKEDEIIEHLMLQKEVKELCHGKVLAHYHKMCPEWEDDGRVVDKQTEYMHELKREILEIEQKIEQTENQRIAIH